jgi:type IV pilus assembly protein PilM
VAVQLPFVRKTGPVIGLDIGSSAVKVVEMNVSSKGFEVTGLGMASVQPEAIVQGAFLNSSAIVDAIREAMSNAGIKNKDVAAAVSGHSVIVKQIGLPVMTAEELEESIRWEAEQYIPFDVNEVNLDFQILADSAEESQMDVLLVAAKKDLVDDYVQVISEAGFNPAIVDVAAFAVENAFEANYDMEPNEVVALVNVGAQVVNINVIKDGNPAFTRDISTGGNQYTEEIQKALSIGFEEAERIKLGNATPEDKQAVVPQEVDQAMRAMSEQVLGEITRSLDFFTATSAESRIGRILISGGSARVPDFDKAFQDRTNVPVQILNPFERMLPSRKFDEEYLREMAPYMTVGVGLGLRRMDER